MTHYIHTERTMRMTSPSNQTNERQMVVENIDQYLADGRPVFDKNGERVGEVKMYSTAAGYLMVGAGALGRKDLYIPFRLIRSIDPREVYLSETKDTLASKYTQPPQISTVTETRLVPGPHGTMKPQTRQVQMVQSGYDAQPATVSTVDAEQIAKQLALGMAVHDVTGARLGDLTQYDIPRSLMVVEQGVFNPRVLFVPFSAIKRVDRDALAVYLSLPKDTLLKQHAM